MKYYSELLKIIDGAIKNDKKKVINYSNHLSTKLRNNGEEKIATRIDNLVFGVMESSMVGTNKLEKNTLTQLPFDQESKLELGEIIINEQNQVTDEGLILNALNKTKLDDLVRMYEKSDKLVELGFDMSYSVLLYGPPGCGKTMSAYYVAKKMELPLLIVRLDTLISSYLGSTSKNIRRIFDYAASNPCVLFLDEFDAIAKLRDDKQELGELKRVVNSLLQNIDSVNQNTVLIAATNHENLLDKAVWRRFNTRVYIPLPERNERLQIVNKELENYKIELELKERELLADITKDLSFSDIKQIILTTLKKILIHDKKVELSDFVNSLFEYVLNYKDINDEVQKRRLELKYLLEKNGEISNRNLAYMLKCHYTTIGRDRKELQL